MKAASPEMPWSWLKPEDVIRIALGSYYQRCRETHEVEPGPTGAAWFLLEFTRDLAARFNAHALAAGVNKPECSDVFFAVLPDGMEWPERRRAWPRRASAGGASMAQGCAAVSSAVGPAPEVLQGGAEAPHADPLFFGPDRQDLPAGEPVDHTQTQQEASLHG